MTHSYFSQCFESKSKFFNEKNNKKQDFHASGGWLDNFKKRFSIHFLQISGKMLLVDDSEIADFIAKLEVKLNRWSLFQASCMRQV